MRKISDYGFTQTFDPSVRFIQNEYKNVKDPKPYRRPMLAKDIGVKEVTQLRANL